MEEVLGAQQLLISLGQEGGGSTLVSLAPMLIIFAIFYFLLFRPQLKRQKQHAEFLKQIKKGDEVITQSGMVGRVVQISADPFVTLELGEPGSKVRVRFLKSQVLSRVSDALAAEQGKSPAPAKAEERPEVIKE
jgi:preprotein translocase subunit YajC